MTKKNVISANNVIPAQAGIQSRVIPAQAGIQLRLITFLDPRFHGDDNNHGFTLIELLIVIGIIAILSGVVIMTINPLWQFANARNNQRKSNVFQILNAISLRITDNKGVFEAGCSVGSIPTATIIMATGSGNYYDIAQCLVPIYLPSMPYDPSATSANWNSTSSYNTGYQIQKDSTSGRITVSAPSTELNAPIISATK